MDHAPQSVAVPCKDLAQRAGLSRPCTLEELLGFTRFFGHRRAHILLPARPGILGQTSVNFSIICLAVQWSSEC